MIRKAFASVLTVGLLAPAAPSRAQDPIDREVKPVRAVEPGPRPMVTYRVRIVEMAGLSWRDALGARLRTLKKTPTFAAWKVDGEVIPSLLELAVHAADPEERSNLEDLPVSVDDLKEEEYIGAGNWVQNVNGNMFQATESKVQYGLRLELSGRRIDREVRLRATVADIHLLGFSKVPVPSPTDPEIRGEIAWPELKLARNQGEWTIPEEGALVMSLGMRHDVPKNSPTFDEYPRWMQGALELSIGILEELRMIDQSTIDWIVESQTRREYWNAPVRERLVIVEARPAVGGGKVAASAR